MDFHEKHREPAENYCLKSVTVSMELNWKSILQVCCIEEYSCENQAADEDYSNAKISDLIILMQMAVFSEEIELEKASFQKK